MVVCVRSFVPKEKKSDTSAISSASKAARGNSIMVPTRYCSLMPAFLMRSSATRRVADDLIKKAGIKLPYLVGTMIELPRAALLADEIAEVSDFFSFGTNDLTQTTMGLSRDDAGRFLPDYVDEKKAGVFTADPFQSLDQKGVGMLMEWAVEKGRKTRDKLKVGICGEHGGDADSVKFCHAIGMDYVSASPFRVPISRLAAAQAVIEDKAAANSKRK